jgi:hypothetical protein
LKIKNKKNNDKNKNEKWVNEGNIYINKIKQNKE